MLPIMGLTGWYLFLQILFPAAIGIGGGLIAWAQWRTANQKVLLDLFDRRFRLFQEVRTINRKVVGGGKATSEQGQDMLRLWNESRFLFGPEIAGNIEALFNALFDLEVADKEMVGLQAGPELAAQVHRRREGLATVSRIQIALPDLVAPYMRMDTKAIRSPRQWLKDKLSK
jgi:hypothetical protein